MLLRKPSLRIMLARCTSIVRGEEPKVAAISLLQVYFSRKREENLS